jgi:FAD/FMN-containing dehydrogenase
LESIIGAYGVKYDSAAVEQVHPVARDRLATIKAAVDPQNLIAPGRYGTPLRHVDRA